MASLSSPGIGSGLDINGLVSKLMEAERLPVTVLDKKEASNLATISAYGALSSQLTSLQTSAKSLATSSLYAAKKTWVQDSTYYSASASSDAATGGYNINVQQLAKSQKLQSTGFSASTDSVGTGTITIEFGTYSAGAFTPNANKTAKTVSIPTGSDTVSGVAAAINAAHTGVSATIVNDGTNSRIVLSPEDGGAANALRISVVDDDGNNTNNAGLSRLVYDNTTGGIKQMTETVAAQDSKITVDSQLITKSTNVITDAIQGVTLTLTKEHPDLVTTTAMTVSRDYTAAKTAIASFVTTYNATAKLLSEDLAYNAETKKAGLLQGEGAARSVQQQLRNAVAGAVSGLSTGISTFSELGVSFQRDGTLAFDSAKLDSVLADPTKDIGSLLVGTTSLPGIAANIQSVLDGALDTDGIIASRTDGLTETNKSIAARRAAINLRLLDIEQRYRDQFNALDALVASMKSTSDFLTQQLANLPSASSSSK